MDEGGNRIKDENGGFVFNAVPTSDWGSPKTLEQWRKMWAKMCNAKFAEKGLDCRIDHRSYERQGVDLHPTVHEGVAVRAMEKKSIKTEKGDLNRWIKATNATIRAVKKKISNLIGWLQEIKEELSKPQSSDIVSFLNAYYNRRYANAYSQKGKISNLKDMAEAINYLSQNEIYTVEDLENRVYQRQADVSKLKKAMDSRAVEKVKHFIGLLYPEFTHMNWEKVVAELLG